MSKFKYILSDLDDTLCYSHVLYETGLKKAWGIIKKQCDISFEQFKKVFTQSRNQIKKKYQNAANDQSRALVFKQMVKDLNCSTKPDTIYKMYKHYWEIANQFPKPMPELNNFLDKVNNTNIPIYIVSDGLLASRLQKVSMLEIHDQITDVISSEETKINKPAKEFFKYTMNYIGCKPEECIMLGNNLYGDIYGAKRFGIYSVLLDKGDNVKDPKPDINIKPDAIINDLTELLELL